MAAYSSNNYISGIQILVWLVCLAFHYINFQELATRFEENRILSLYIYNVSLIMILKAMPKVIISLSHYFSILVFHSPFLFSKKSHFSFFTLSERKNLWNWRELRIYEKSESEKRRLTTLQTELVYIYTFNQHNSLAWSAWPYFTIHTHFWLMQ